MSILVQGLSKIYGSQQVVRKISFSIAPGEIVGFLGPNGAGKSTTMKMLTGYVPPTSGEIRICDQPVEDNTKVRRLIGYLPEHNPLYLDMYVHEFLQFAGKVYGLRGAKLGERVKEMVERCGLTVEQNKKIESLSKGFRQRVGLAQALIHDPQVLILDEPTTGLDPNQIVEIRQLIKDVSADKTVVFSTHIMQEVQALCERVLVINNGELVADELIRNLLANQSGARVVIAEFDKPVTTDELKQITGVDDVLAVTPTSFRLRSNNGTDLRPEVFRFAADRSLSLVGLREEQSTLETVFRDLTQNTSVS
jgi:ABC-2 type transport system ATP-binding protein